MTVITLSDTLSSHKRIWATLITNKDYLPGVLTLNYSLKKVNSAYPLVALYTNQLDIDALNILHKNNILTLMIDPIKPNSDDIDLVDKRFIDTWSKLYFFKLTQFDRIVQLDSDMLIRKNLDELMTLDLNGNKFGSTHACVCNPNKFDHYPKTWIRENCSFTDLSHPTHVAHANSGLSKCNSGILVINPSLDLFNQIQSKLNDTDAVNSYIFPDQDLLVDLFNNDWLALSHNYNCLKTFKNAHPNIWDLDHIKIIHYILSPKPWNVDRSYNDLTGTFHLWWDENDERISNIQ